jgi:hypothetical protein
MTSQRRQMPGRTAYFDGQFIAGTKGRIASFSLSHYIKKRGWVDAKLR